MGIENIVLFRKLTGLEWTAKKRGFNLEEAIEDENHLGLDTDMVDSHFRQIGAMDFFMDKYGGILGNPLLQVGDNFDQEVVDRSNIVVAFGGDNYGQHASHFIKNQRLVVVNNDTVKSHGAIAHFDVESFGKFLPKLLNNDFNIEEWIRLRAFVRGRLLPIEAISEVAVVTLDPFNMNRYQVTTPAGTEVQKGSGILVATLYGKTDEESWTKKEIQYLEGRYNLDINTHQALFAARADSRVKRHMLSAIINPGEKVEIVWLAHGDGGIKLDPKNDDPLLDTFTRGDKIEVEISDQPLRVIIP